MVQLGQHVRIRRPTGQVVIDSALVVRWAGGEFVFVEGDGPDGKALYGVPVSSVEPVHWLPISARMTKALRQAFGLSVVSAETMEARE